MAYLLTISTHETRVDRSENNVDPPDRRHSAKATFRKTKIEFQEAERFALCPPAGLKDIRGWTSPTHNLEPVFVFRFGINNVGHTHGPRKRSRRQHKPEKGSASAALHGPRSLKHKIRSVKRKVAGPHLGGQNEAQLTLNGFGHSHPGVPFQICKWRPNP